MPKDPAVAALGTAAFRLGFESIKRMAEHSWKESRVGVVIGTAMK